MSGESKTQETGPSMINLSIKERIAAFVLQTPDAYKSLDISGNTMGESKSPLPSQTIIADERSQRGASVNQKYLETITKIQDVWQQQIRNLSIDKFHLTDDQGSITVTTDRNYRIYFNLTNDIDKQIIRLAAFLADSSIEQPQEYLDLRYEDHLYAK